MEDDELVRKEVDRFRQGDQEAAQLLYERYASLVLNVVRSKLPPVAERPHIDSYGLRQDAFKSFFSAVDKPSFNSAQWNIAGLLVRISQYKSLARLRRRRPPTSTDPKALQIIVEAMVATDEGRTSRQEVLVEFREHLDRALMGLPEWQQKVITYVLDDKTDWTLDDIAERCDCDRVEVELAIKALYAKLRKILKDLESET